MEFTLLASGSKGNATLISGAEGAILIDMGLSFRELRRRLELLGIDPPEIQAIFVTHEHSDHIKGVGIAARKLGIPVYISRDTFAASGALFRGSEKIRFLTADNHICGLTVSPLSTSHDVADPCAFIVREGDCKLGVITDLGFPTAAVKRGINDLNALIIESNHCPRLLREGPYPWFLKQRISGQRGHLSNDQTGELLRDHLSPKTRLVYLAHLSEDNNEPELALSNAGRYLAGRRDVTLKAAAQHEPTVIEQVL